MPIFFFMLIKFDEEKDSYYLCSCSDWSLVVLAGDVNEAANKSVGMITKELGNGANISACLRVKKIEEKVEISDHLVRMDQILSDIGMYKESKALKEIFNNDRD